MTHTGTPETFRATATSTQTEGKPVIFNASAPTARIEGRPITFTANPAPSTRYEGKAVTFSAVATYFAICRNGQVIPARPGMVVGGQIIWLSPEL